VFISGDLTRFSRTSLGKAERAVQDFLQAGGPVPDAPCSLPRRAGYPGPTGGFWQALPCGHCRNSSASLWPSLHAPSLPRVLTPQGRRACALSFWDRGFDRTAPEQVGLFRTRLGASSTGRPCQGRVMTTLPVAWRVRSRSSPSTARSSGRTWLICGVKSPSANQPNSLAMLAVSTSGRKAR
jgi:hypothetical protein